MASGFKIDSPFLNGKDLFFANTEQEALAEMFNRAGDEVRVAPYPSDTETKCCISSDGQLYRLSYVADKHIFVGWGPLQPVRPYGHRAGVIYYIGKRAVRAERLVYCAFVLGLWSNDVVITFKDGDPYNVRLENLATKSETDYSAWKANIEKEAALYQKEYRAVVKYVEWQCDLRREDAENIVSDVFMSLTDPKIYSHSRDFISAWMFYSKKHGLNYYERSRGLYVELEDWNSYSYDKPVELDFLGIIANEKHRDILSMISQGYQLGEIAEKYGTTPDSIRSIMKHAVKKIRAYCARDFKVLGVRGKVLEKI